MADNIFKDRALQKYLDDISKIQPLTREAENKLAIEAKKGNKEAINKLVQSNLKFVVKVAARYQNRGLTFSELISEGNMGLIKAIEKFEPEQHNKLISYAVWWIKQRILFALAEKTHLIRMPLGKANIAGKIKSAKDKIFSETGESATIEEISKLTQLKKKAIDKMSKQNIDTISIDDESYTRKYDKITLNEFLKDPEISDPKKIYYRKKVKDSIDRSIKNLPSREARIVKEYFGLEGNKSKNFAQIGEDLGLSRERVRQIQKKALEKILEDTYDEVENDIDFLINQ